MKTSSCTIRAEINAVSDELVAEREGFEPSIPVSQYTRLAGERLRPTRPSLRVCSNLQQRRGAITTTLHKKNQVQRDQYIKFTNSSVLHPFPSIDHLLLVKGVFELNLFSSFQINQNQLGYRFERFKNPLARCSTRLKFRDVRSIQLAAQLFDRHGTR
jgi:hypothetical protein